MGTPGPAQFLGIFLKEIQQLRRAAVNTLDTVEVKIHARIQQASKPRNQTCRPLAEPVADNPLAAGAAVPPIHCRALRDTVIGGLRQGENHGATDTLLQQSGFEGSASAAYQYILKLRQEIPAEFP